jgi:cytoskeleton protein RodZ
VSAPAVESAQRDGPGPRLRSARESQGLSVQQAAEQLNLDATVVIAIENDDLAALGAPVFARGHLRRYGALLGVPDHELLTSYEQARTQPDQPSLVPHSRLEMAPVRSRPVWAWAIGGALLFLLAAGLVAYVSEYGLTLPGASLLPGSGTTAPGQSTVTLADEGSSPAAGAAGGGSTPAAAPPEASGPQGTGGDNAAAAVPAQPTADGLQATTGAAAAATPAAGAATAPVAPPVPPGHVSVTVTFATDSWAEIYDGAGKAVMYDLGRAGTQRTIAAAAPLSVTLGNAPGVTLAVNGRATALPPRPAGLSVARFQVAADGTLR